MNIYLIDGHSYIYRAYHAIRGLSTSKGQPTNALYGFTTMLLKILREKKPDALCVALDSEGPTERHLAYAEYKAQRPETPADLLAQIPYIKKTLAALRIAVFEAAGHEADDIICTVARQFAEEGNVIFIVSGDKDMMQLVDHNIKIYDPMKDIVIDAEAVLQRLGIPPSRVPEMMALTGDAIDNIPGVKGIGEKTARDLLTGVEDLNQLFSDPSRIGSERIRRLIEDNKDTILLSRNLATLSRTVPVAISAADLALRDPDWEVLLRLFTEFEFTSLLKLIPAGIHAPRGRYETITTPDRLRAFLAGQT